MADTHAERADELAAMANQALERPGKPPQNALVTGDPRVADLARWAKVRALQAQAQIHATLALNDTIASTQQDRG
ncbi:hypothetical protein [Nocardia cyriacigeorgica]|uniref:Uncharacterized protein n=1 Tax=Nocardia cyriacigeorgica TaxID=135487 RepID=A0A6P1DEQ2_9NOCA|nr:hypothetical protein [Nocardia cyriacigeorgica]NEW42516.1 hypothetical protein [Nocardia cyriacigeorgica]NEW47969.1 hypothetical protein [Nocardia cyriacigeorgica]